MFPPGTTLDVSRRPTVVVDTDRLPVGSRLTLTGEPVKLGADDVAAATPCVARGDVFWITPVS